MTHAALVKPWTTIEQLFDQELQRRPADHILQLIKPVEQERQEVRDFISRVVHFMLLSNLSPDHITPSLGWLLGTMAPGLLPGAWGNVIPPFTLEDRHVEIDRYLAANPWATFSDGTTMLEMGCGFPPQTAVDAATRFASWQLLGADPRFDPYVLHDAEGNYACMSDEGDVRYFHPANPGIATYMALYKDPAATFQRFRTIFERLLPLLPVDEDGTRAEVTHDGARLVRNAIQGFTRSNLHFVQAGIGAEMEPVDVIRVFNVLMYFDADFRRDAEWWALNTLKPNGLLLCGGDNSMSTEARYTVYQRVGDALVPREFAFSLDNVRPPTMNSWFCLHNDERETFLTARIVGLLRRDDEFREAFDARVDALMREQRLWVRRADGALLPAPDQPPATQFLALRMQANAQLRAEGFHERAVAVLQRAGLRAWENAVGHIAIDPADLAV